MLVVGCLLLLTTAVVIAWDLGPGGRWAAWPHCYIDDELVELSGHNCLDDVDHHDVAVLCSTLGIDPPPGFSAS